MYNLKERFYQLITLDNIRLCKIGEIIEYTFIFILLLIGLMFILNKYYFGYFTYDSEILKAYSKYEKIRKLFFIIFRDTVVIIILLFYLRKIALLFPSIPTYFNKKFIPYTTLEYSIHIALVVIFMELLPEYKKKLYLLRTLLTDDDRIY